MRMHIIYSDENMLLRCVGENGKADNFHDLRYPTIVEASGDQSWFCNNLRHRVGGPAIISPDGTEWFYLNGIPYNESDYWEVLRCGPGYP